MPQLQPEQQTAEFALLVLEHSRQCPASRPEYPHSRCSPDSPPKLSRLPPEPEDSLPDYRIHLLWQLAAGY